MSKSWEELARGWPLVSGAMLGMAVGVVAFGPPVTSLAMVQLENSFGWSRTEIAMGSTVLGLSVACVSPLLGWLSDRVSEVVIIMFSMVALALGLWSVSRMTGDLATYYLIFGFLGVFGAGTATLAYARLISANFDAARGRALGLALTGNGLSTLLLPLFLAPYIASHGWRAAYVMLAIIVLVATPLLGILLHKGNSRAGRSSARLPSGPDIALTGAIRLPVFWIMAFAYSAIALAVTGLLVHFAAFLADRGARPAAIGVLSSLLGAGLILGRLVTGWLIDRYFAPRVAAVTMAICSAAIAGAAFGGLEFAPFAALAVGLAFGAELDLVGYLTARYFGMEIYGRCYGIFYACILTAAAVSPVAYGLSADYLGSYNPALFGGALLLAIASICHLFMPRFKADEDQAVAEPN